MPLASIISMHVDLAEGDGGAVTQRSLPAEKSALAANHVYRNHIAMGCGADCGGPAFEIAVQGSFRGTAMASDRYVHYFNIYNIAQFDNLRALARYLIVNSKEIDAGGGFLFDTDTGRVTQVSISVWGWVEGLIRDAETFIAEGGRAAMFTMVIGGGLLCAALLVVPLAG